MSGFAFGIGVPGGWVTAAVLAILAIGAIALGVRELIGEGRSRRRAVLLGLRVATAVAALLVAVQPRWTGERLQRGEGSLAVLVDASRSMIVRARPGEDGETRAAAAAKLLSRWSGQAGARRASAWTFGASARPSDLATLGAAREAVEDETRIGDAIAEVAGRDAEGALGAVVIVSDGADTSGTLRVADVERLRVRVHAVAVGARETLRDDAIARVEADALGFLRQPARVRVTLRSIGGRGGSVPVTLRRGDEVEREAVVEVPPDGEGTVDIPFTPMRLGRAVYRLTIPLAPDDAVPENNERAFLVRVQRDKLRVLLVAGRPSWDERFLRAFLKSDPSIDLVSFFILRTASDLTMASPDELALIPFPTDELFSEHLGSFDVVFFQNFEFGPYQMAPYLPSIRDYVLRGGGFAMIGGDLAFASGGYAETALAEVLPVTMPPSGTPETQAIRTDRFEPRIVPELARHPILELLPDAAANAAAWAALAPLEGVNVLTGLRQGGRSLLVHPVHRDASGSAMPVLAVGQPGRGRTLALATDTSWRWGITTGGRSGDASAHTRFYERVLRWLAKDPALEPAQITTDRERYGPRARVRARAILRDDRYEPIADREVKLEIADAAGRPIAAGRVRTDGQGRAAAELAGPSDPGGYRVIARLADAPAEAPPLCEEWLVVEAGGDELADPRARPDTLRALVEATGGTFVEDPERAPPLASFDATRTRSLGTMEIAPFATWWSWLLVLALFAAEWTLRRTWGKR